MSENKKALLVITEGEKIIARGIWLPEAVAYLDDDGNRQAGYPDTGVFLLLEGSQMTDPPEKLKKYVSEGVTTKDIALQSRNKAAELVLGAGKGDTNSWK